jgi:hypothetical protein
VAVAGGSLKDAFCFAIQADLEPIIFDVCCAGHGDDLLMNFCIVRTDGVHIKERLLLNRKIV